MIAAPGSPESCPHRRALPAVGDGETAICGLIERLADQHRSIVDARVSRQACTACVKCSAAVLGRINPVVASSLYGAAASALRDHSRSDLDVAQIGFLQAYAARHLDVAGTDGAIANPCQEHVYLSDHVQRSCDLDAPSRFESARRVLAMPRRLCRWPQIGLMGWNAPTGLGYLNFAIAAQLPIRRWLMAIHPSHAPQSLPLRVRRRAWPLGDSPTPSDLRQSLGGLDWLMFVESPLIDGITAAAKQAGVRVACVCNWEFACPVNSDWLYDVDLLICPTQHTFRVMQAWKQRFGFGWRLLHLPWPIDDGGFRFRLREKCRRFVFVNGWGGCRGRRAGRSPTPYQRKGIELLFEAARLLPRVPFIVYSQTAELPPWPPNVQLRPPPLRNRDLYQEGDVCVQPSHWEGIGLQLLESQAAGMPLITTDAPPMNEHNPFRTIRVCKTEDVLLGGDYPVPSQLMDPRDLAATLEAVFETDIHDASRQARRFVESEHNWASAAAAFRLALNEPS